MLKNKLFLSFLSLMLAMIMLMMSLPVSATTTEDVSTETSKVSKIDSELLEDFYSYSVNINNPDVGPFDADNIIIHNYKEVDGLVIFSGYPDIPSYSVMLPMDACVEVMGDWVVSNTGYFSHGNGFCTFVYDGESFYDIKEAWNIGLITDMSMLEDFCDPVYVTRIGDVNRDKKIDIKDATTLQKHLAELISLPVAYGFGYIYDYTKDGETNVKDVTAIQKYIAGLE